MLGMFSSKDDDMMALYGSHESVQAMRAALDAELERADALAACKKQFESVAASDVGGGAYMGGAYGGYAH